MQSARQARTRRTPEARLEGTHHHVNGSRHSCPKRERARALMHEHRFSVEDGMTSRARALEELGRPVVVKQGAAAIQNEKPAASLGAPQRNG